MLGVPPGFNESMVVGMVACRTAVAYANRLTAGESLTEDEWVLYREATAYLELLLRESRARLTSDLEQRRRAYGDDGPADDSRSE